MKLQVFFITAFLSIHSIAAPTAIKACFTDWFPYSYLENGQPSGLSIEIYNAVIKRAGLTISYDKKPWKRCKQDFSAGLYDAIVDGGVDIPNSLHAQQRPIPWVMLLWVHKSSEVQAFKGYHQFDQKKMGFVRGYGYPDDFMEYKGFLSKRDVDNDTQGLNMLDRGRFHAFFGDLVNNTQIVKKEKFNVRAIGPAIQVNYLTLCFSTLLKKEHQQFETALNQMYKDNSIDKIYNQYLGLSYQEFMNKYNK